MRRLNLFRAAALVFAAALIAGCTGQPTATATPTIPPTAPPSPTPNTAADAAGRYLAAWGAGDYSAMYALLAAESQSALAQTDFEKQYKDNLSIMGAQGLAGQVTGANEGADSAQVQAHLKFTTLVVGDVETDITLNLKKAGAEWRVLFDPTLIWPDLHDGQKLYMAPLTSERGTIYDRSGEPMVKLTDGFAVGVVPAQITDPGAVDSVLGRVFGVAAPTIHARYELAVPEQYQPIGEVTLDELKAEGLSYLVSASPAGIQWSPYTARFYYGNGAAAHVTGYVSWIGPEELETYRAQGYAGDEKVGKVGLEVWAEAQLAGRPGGQLMVLDAQNQVIQRLTQAAQPTPAQDVYTTLDFELQKAAQFALGDLTGAAVVLDRNTGAVLAMASSPTFDPNVFDAANLNSILLGQMVGDQRQPLLNRAAQGTYPAGSVFKVVTMSAAMTSGIFTPDSQYDCTGEWNEIGLAQPYTDWKEGGHGTLTLTEGLSASCNPWFWHIGNALNQYDPGYLAEIARAFGLGQPTGLGQVDEAGGLIPDPQWLQQNQGQTWGVIDTLNLSIGQGNVLVTPLQIARMMAAIGNGGTLYQPQLVLKIQSEDGTPTYEFQPAAVGQLPLDAAQLAALQEGLHMVTVDCPGCIGTARNRFRGLPGWLKIAGKTGTAEDPGEFGTDDPDAWFAGYTFAEREGRPDIAIAVVISNRGGGSSFAAPVFRRIVEAYYGLNYRLYPWEASLGVTATEVPTPTPDPNATPTP